MWVISNYRKRERKVTMHLTVGGQMFYVRDMEENNDTECLIDF